MMRQEITHLPSTNIIFISDVYQCISSVGKQLYLYAENVAQGISWVAMQLHTRVERVVSANLSKWFFAGYVTLDSKKAAARTKFCIERFGALALRCQNDKGIEIDALYVPSHLSNRSNNVIVFAETTSYQNRLENGMPSKYRHFLDCGADIVLWNPTKLQGKQYACDLLSVLKT